MKRLSFVICVTALAVGCDGGGTRADAGCGDGQICLVDAGHVDGGPGADGGPDSGPPGCATPANVGEMGGRCRSGTMCGTGLTCAEELTRNPNTGVQFTLRNTFVIPIPTASGEDPAHPGEYLVTDGLPDVPIGFGPGGQCTALCTLPTTAMPMPPNTCGGCATCSATLGGSAAVGALGVTTRTFVDLNNDMMGDPICRQNCVYDPATNGGCPTGYTCDEGENICVEACTTDSQCQAGFGNSRHEGLVAVLNPAFTCNTTTGHCQWTPSSPTAVAGSACDSNLDCPSGIGACFIGGHCATYQCNTPDPADPTGMTALYPCPTGTICLGFGGNNGAACLQGCNSVADCPAGNSCDPLMGTAGGFTGYCIGICHLDSDCHADERCNLGGFQDTTLGVCDNFCTPAGETAMTGAVTCAADEFCVPEGTTHYGYCQQLNQLCGDDTNCYGNQACEYLGNDGSGRCIDGCATSADCTAVAANAECRIQSYCVDAMGVRQDACTNTGTCPTGQTCTAGTRGVCRVPGGMCSPSQRVGTAMEILFQLRGDPQCAPTEACNGATANMIFTCAHCGAPSERCCTGNSCVTGTCNAGRCP